MTPVEESTRWLEWLYGADPVGPIWIGGHGDGFRGRTFTAIDEAVQYGQQLDAKQAGGVYHRLTTMHAVEEGRGAAGDSTYLPAFAMDLDLKGPGHKALNYPETEAELRTLLHRAGLPEPSVWVHSGGGRYPFWRLDRPADLTLPGQLERAAGISSDLHKLVIEWAKDAGLKVDNTSDLARVYRLPGTHNRKAGGEVLAAVAWDEWSGAATPFSLADLRTSVDRAPRVRERIEAAAAASSAAGAPDWGLADSQLFAPAGLPLDGPRLFTTAEAMEYVQPALNDLRGAQDGEINNRLNAAAVMMAHFGEEFWSREAAVKQLMSALEHTEYDGASWDAAGTIGSAYNAMATKDGPEYWRAQRKPDPVPSVVPEQRDGLTRLEWLESQLTTADALADRPAPIPLVYGLLDLDSLAWMIGEPGSFKSFVALDLAAHVAQGRPWQGHRTRQVPVLYLAAEGAAGMTLRTRAWRIERGVMAGVDFLPLPIQVSKIDDWLALIALATKRSYGLIVLDTQARITVGLDENTAKDSGVFIAAGGALKDATKACVLTVHHTGRDGKNARGSSAIDGAQDTELKLSRATPRSSMQVIMREDKQKDMAEDEAGLKLKLKIVNMGKDPETERPLSSLVLLNQDEWRDAEIAVEQDSDAGQEVDIPAPGAWTRALLPHHRSENARRILQVLAAVAGETGRTEAQIRTIVLERWYDGKPLKAKAGHLDAKSWHRGWTAALALVSASGEQVVTNTGGGRYALNPSSLPSESIDDSSSL